MLDGWLCFFCYGGAAWLVTRGIESMEDWVCLCTFKIVFVVIHQTLDSTEYYAADLTPLLDVLMC